MFGVCLLRNCGRNIGLGEVQDPQTIVALVIEQEQAPQGVAGKPHAQVAQAPRRSERPRHQPEKYELILVERKTQKMGVELCFILKRFSVRLKQIKQRR